MSKLIKVLVPDRMAEEFFRLFPGHGERSTFLRKVISRTIIHRKKKNNFAEFIEKEIREE